jgi:hypothetical protein
VSDHRHRRRTRDAGPFQVADGRPPEIVRDATGDFGAGALDPGGQVRQDVRSPGRLVEARFPRGRAGRRAALREALRRLRAPFRRRRRDVGAQPR